METKKIVITGGPGTGKTAVINRLEKDGFVCMPEIIRSMTLEAKKEGDSQKYATNPLLFVSDPLGFNEKILQGRKNQFQQAIDNSESHIFFDRALPDVLAYMDYFDQPYGDLFMEACKTNVYDEVFILPPWKEIYVVDNERLESFNEAVQIHEHLERTYLSYGYDVKDVPLSSIEERVTFILEKLNIK